METLQQLANSINQFEVRREKYALPDLDKSTTAKPDDKDDYSYNCVYNYPAIRQPPSFTEPMRCTWLFMSQEEVIVLLNKQNLDDVKKLLDKKLRAGKSPKGVPLFIALELLYTGAKFARNAQYNCEQTGALLSMLYLTYNYFNCCHRIMPDDVYWYFKELVSFHSLDFSPTHSLIFQPQEAQRLLNFLCKIFLRHLPLIRLLGLPNFELAINTYIPPFPVFKKAKKGKEGKEGKKDKKDKKKKK